MLRAILIAAILTLADLSRADSIITDKQVKSQVVVTFWVKTDANSPYQGTLFYDATAYGKLAKGAVDADAMAQYTAWKSRQDALKASPPPSADDMAKQVTDLQTQKSALDQQINVLMADPAVAAKVK